MYQKDLIRMPLGSFELGCTFLTHYSYVIKKDLTKDGDNIWIITEKGALPFSPNVCIFSKVIMCYNENSGRYGKNLDFSIMAGIAGISVHSDNIFWSIRTLYLKPRGSFRQYVNNEIAINHLTKRNEKN